MLENLGPLEKLIAELGKLPGIGPKSAARLAFFLLKHPDEEAIALAEAIIDLKKNIRHCSVCWNITAQDPCSICSDQKRDRSVICVVEQPFELLSIERTGEYRGLYHVLMGALSPISDIGPADLTIESLLERVCSEEVREIIIATNPTHDGEATAVYLADALKPSGVTVSRIAQGLPVGSNLEYVDSVTMARSILSRQKME